MDAHSYENTTEKKRIQLHVQAASPDKLPEDGIFRYVLTADPDKIIQEL